MVCITCSDWWPSLLTLLRQEMLEDRRQSCVVYPYIRRQQFTAGDESDMSRILMITPGIKVYKGKTIREFSIEGLALTCQYFIGYVPEEDVDTSLEWGELAAHQLCPLDDTGFAGLLPGVLTSTHFGVAPNLFFAAEPSRMSFFEA